MKLYATIESDYGRNARVARKGANSCLEIELSAFSKRLGIIYFSIEQDADGKDNQYLLTYTPRQNDDTIIIEEGNRSEGLIQRIKG